jgi:hypothetical protein
VLELLRSSLLPTRGASVISSGDAMPRGDLDSEPVSVINEGAPSAETIEYPEGEGMGVSKPRARVVEEWPYADMSSGCGRDPGYGSKR